MRADDMRALSALAPTYAESISPRRQQDDGHVVALEGRFDVAPRILARRRQRSRFCRPSRSRHRRCARYRRVFHADAIHETIEYLPPHIYGPVTPTQAGRP